MTTATLLDIGDIARLSGLPPSTLRFYEDRGLIESAGRRGLRRLYEPKVLDRLAMIVAAQQAGFRLGELLLLFTGKPSDPELRRQLTEKADRLDERIAQLTAMRDVLRHVVGCQNARLVDCPCFIEGVRASLPRRRPPPRLPAGEG